jgi:hypothetical protein
MEMTRFRLSTAAWKWLVSALALCSATLLVIEFGHAVQPLASGEVGSLGVTLTDQIGANNHGQGTYLLRIDSLDPSSPLLAKGARVGDQIRFHDYANRWRKFGLGEKVGLTLVRDGSAIPLRLEVLPTPLSFAEYADYGAHVLLALPALLFGVLIGFKQSHGRTYRSLALTFLALSLCHFYVFSFSPAGKVYTISKVANLITYSLIWYWCTAFVLHYQDYRQVGLRRWLTRLFPAYRLLSFATAAYSVGFALGLETPYLWLGTLLGAVFGLALVIASLLDGWRSCSGETRQRHLWLLLSFALGTVPAMLTLVPALDWQLKGMRVTVMLYFVGQLLMYLGLAYAVLRHRVFNFDFAVSRVVVFSVVSGMLLCAFGLIEWRVHAGSHGAGPEHRNLVGEALVALGSYLVFHLIHDKLERAVEHVFFEKWHVNEHRLREYVRQAAHITTIDALLSSLRSALDRFTGEAGCAIYLRQAAGDYALAAGTLPDAPALVDTDDNLAVSLRADMAPLFCDRLPTTLPGELALPMCHRGALNGFVLLGSKRGGESYRPDECEVLGFAAHQVGLDLHALRVEVLENELRELERKAEQQDGELQVMAGRRKGVRQLVAG